MMKPAENWYCCDMADLLRAPKIRRISCAVRGAWACEPTNCTTCFYASVFPAAATGALTTKLFARRANPKLSSRCLHNPETDGVLSEWKAESRCGAERPHDS
jgi:hypothetical protein